RTLKKVIGIICGIRRQDDKMAIKLKCIKRVRRRDHLFMELLAGSYANVLKLTIGADRTGKIDDLVGRNLRHEDLTAAGVFNGIENQIDRIFEGDVETGHITMGDRKHSRAASL